VFKVGGKMFALSSLSQWERRAFGEFEMRARTAQELRAQFDDKARLAHE
jgi:hypothetical protein